MISWEKRAFVLHSAYQYQLVINLNCFSIFYRGQKSPRYTEQHNWYFGGGRGGVNSGFVTYSLSPPWLLLSLVVFEAATVGTMISMMMIFPDKIMNMMLLYKIRLMMLINLTRYKPLTLINVSANQNLDQYLLYTLLAVTSTTGIPAVNRHETTWSFKIIWYVRLSCWTFLDKWEMTINRYLPSASVWHFVGFDGVGWQRMIG